MSYAYRIEVKESRLIEVSGQDGLTSRLEVVDVLPAGEMQEIITRRLLEAGFEKNGEELVATIEGIQIRIQPENREVSLTASKTGSREVEVKLNRSLEAHTPGEIAGAGKKRAEIRQELEKEASRKLDQQAQIARDLMTQHLREGATKTLKEALPGIRETLSGISHRIQAEALETKARRMGRVEKIEHDPVNQSMTIVVKLD